MKKIMIALMSVVTLFVGTTTARADKPEFAYSIGADVVSEYIFRGTRCGGLAIQPAAEVSYAGVAFGAWGSVGANDHTFTGLVPELDLYLSYSIAGFSVSATHYYYFGNTHFFGDDTQTEVMLSYTVSDEIPIYLSWYTMIGGGETIGVDDGKFASTYIELGYSHSLPHDLSLSYAIGVNPWTDVYGDGFRVPNLSVRLDHEFALGDACTMTTFIQPVYNITGNSFMCALGCGVSL